MFLEVQLVPIGLWAVRDGRYKFADLGLAVGGESWRLLVLARKLVSRDLIVPVRQFSVEYLGLTGLVELGTLLGGLVTR